MIKMTLPFVSALFVYSFANAEDLGEWCDTPLPGIIEYDVKVELTGDAAEGFVLIQTFSDGSRTIEELTRNGAQFHSVKMDGKFYRLREDGALEVIFKSTIDYVLEADSFPKNTLLNEISAVQSVCY